MNHFRPHSRSSRLRLLGATLVVVFVAAACGGDSEVASVADESLSQDEVVDLAADIEAAATVGDETLSPEGVDELAGAEGATLDKATAANAITTWVRNEIWYAELAERDAAVTDEQLEASRTELEAIAETDPSVPDLTSALGEEIVRSQALPVVVADYLAGLGTVEFLCSSHILVETEQEALDVLTRLEAGEDFATLATELSIDTGTPGGDLGCVAPAGFVPEFVEGARTVDPPGLSAPVESEFGWHVIDVRSLDTEPAADPAALQDGFFASPEFLALQEEVVARPVTIAAQYGEWDPTTFAVVPPVG